MTKWKKKLQKKNYRKKNFFEKKICKPLSLQPKKIVFQYIFACLIMSISTISTSAMIQQQSDHLPTTPYSSPHLLLNPPLVSEMVGPPNTSNSSSEEEKENQRLNKDPKVNFTTASHRRVVRSSRAGLNISNMLTHDFYVFYVVIVIQFCTVFIFRPSVLVVENVWVTVCVADGIVIMSDVSQKHLWQPLTSCWRLEVFRGWLSLLTLWILVLKRRWLPHHQNRIPR